MIRLKFIYNLCLLLITAVSIGSCTPDQNTSTSQTNSSSAIYNGRDTVAGNYLAGRFAQHQQDWGNAQYYTSKVFSQDKQNEFLAERAFLLSLGSGKMAEAKEYAQHFLNKDKNLNELALIFMTSDAIKNNKFAEALNYVETMPETGLGQYAKPLLKVWSLVGLKRFDEAKAVLKDGSFEFDPTYHIHAGLIAEYQNNNKEAAEHYKIAMANGLELHSAIIIANFFERYGRPEISQDIYKNLDAMYPYKPFSRSRKENSNFANITSPAKGASLAIFDLTSILYNNRAYDSANVYGNIVQMLDANSDFTKIMLGDIAAIYSRNDDAAKIYNSIKKGSPVFWLAKTRVSEVYELKGELSKSIDILKDMAQDTAIKPQVMVSLGDMYSQNNDYANAVNAYDAALADVKDIKEEHWAIIYARGIAKEKVTTWDNAEKDLLAALKMQPHNPSILNFIAYSWAEKGINLDQALAYAQHAAELKPYDGAIIDSYGWILFRMGKYQQAAETIEQAVELLPDDSVILDHLGDAYWKTGRENDARRLWHRAAADSKDAKFKQLSLDKIRHGIITADELQTQKAELEK